MSLVLALIAVLWSAAARQEGQQPAPAAEQLAAWAQELASDDAVAREQALRKLIEAGPAALPLLKPLATSHADDAVRWSARRAFGAISGVTPEEAQQVDEVLRRFAEAQRPDVHGAAKLLLGLGEAALRYTGSRPGAAAGEQQMLRRARTLQALRDLVEGRNLEDQAAAVLAELGGAAVEELAAACDDSSLPGDWRSVALERLLFLGGGRARDVALRLAGDPVPGVRRLAVSWLSRSRPLQDFAQVAAAAASLLAADPLVRTSVQQLAGRVSTAELIDALGHEAAPVRALAAQALGARRAAEAREDLSDLLRPWEAPEVVAEAVLALGLLGAAEDFDAVTAQLAHAQPAVRRAALEAVAGFDQPLALAWTCTALRDADPSVRARAAALLGQSAEARAIAPLTASREDGEPSVAAAVSFSLELLAGAAPGGGEAARAAEPAPAGEEREGLAGDGARILGELAEILEGQFRPYHAAAKQDNPARADKLRDAALAGMRAVTERQPDPQDPEWLVLEAARGEAAVLRQLLRHGAFRDAADLGRLVASLPMDLSARDYILLVHEAAAGMVESVGDRFTRVFFLEDPAGNFNPELLPALFGKEKTSGLMLEDGAGGALVEFVFALTPADRAGLRKGDKVLAVNGELTTGMDARRRARLLRQPADLLVLRDGWTRPLSFRLEPEELAPERLVTSALLPGEIGYLRLQQFAVGAAQKLEWELRKLEQRGARALILDLRGNPGGTVVDAVAIVDKFVPGGQVITTTWTNSPDQERDYEEEIFHSNDSSADRAYPLAVLINECSASASEMTSGALQDLDRAVVVGRTSWGKGIGQMGMGVPGFERPSLFGRSRANLSMNVTVLEYFLPTGRSIQGLGVEPDEPVALPELLGERFELLREAQGSQAVADYAAALIEREPELAAANARFDAWDQSRYPGFAELRAKMRPELSPELARAALRAAIRTRLAAADPELAAADYQEDEDLRAAVAALAASLGLDLAAVPEYADLAE